MTVTPTEVNGEAVWTRLRRRKVVQWGIAYIAGAWGLLQGLAYVTAIFHWPEYIPQSATLALLIGLPIALVVAWYHGDRGERRVKGTELAIITMLFLAGGGIFWLYDRATQTTSAPPAPTAVATATDHSIAVLPFVNMSADKEQEYFADGISEELLNVLAKVPELRVIARTSSFSFKGKDLDIAEIARRLNVANVLEGSVRKSGDKIRITAQLVRASDSSHLWSQTYDRQLTDVFQTQDEIASAVVSQLKVKLLGSVPATRVVDPDAYALFLEARSFGRQYTPEAFEHSISLYKRALSRHPEYPAALEGLAANYIWQTQYGLIDRDYGTQLAREAIDKALSIDPEFASAHADRAWLSINYDGDLAAAARQLEHAFALEPTTAAVIGLTSFLYRRLGRFELAIQAGERLLAIDPMNPVDHLELGHVYRYSGRLDDAVGKYRHALSLSPDYIGVRGVIAEVLLQRGDASAALAEIKQEPDEASRLAGLSLVQHALGNRSESKAALATLIEGFADTAPLYIACVYAYLSDNDRAFEWLNRAIVHHDSSLGSLPVYPMLTGLHSDSRWMPLLRRLGVSAEQLAAIKFDVKLPN